LIQPVASLGRVGRYTCSQSWYWSKARKLRGSVYSVCAVSVDTGAALASGAAYTGMSPPFVVADRSGAAANEADRPLLAFGIVVVGGAACSESSRVTTKTPAAATTSSRTTATSATIRRRC
jgi:hypothetical protein